jgi:hypothetical protein
MTFNSVLKMKVLALVWLALASVVSAIATPEAAVLSKHFHKLTAKSNASFYPPMQFTPNVLNRIPDRTCVFQ